MLKENLDLDLAREWVSQRVSTKRFSHICGVAKTACELAQQVGCDAYLAQLAGWLHDACKETKDKLLVEQAKEFGIKLHPIEQSNGHLLHGPVAACVVKKEFGLKSEDLLHAIAEHTLGAAPMSLLSKVVFLADALEPGRPQEYTDPIWEAMRSPNNESTLNLDKAVLVTCDLNLRFLLDSQKVIHPKTVEVRNYYLHLLFSGNSHDV